MRCTLYLFVILAIQDVNGKGFQTDKFKALNDKKEWFVHVADECDHLSNLLVDINHDVLQLFSWALGDEYDIYMTWINAILPVTIDNDSTWQRMACEIEGVRSLDEAVTLIQSYGLRRATEDRVREAVMRLIMLKPTLQSLATRVKTMTTVGRSWLQKTGYPDVFPIPNTSVEEVEQLFSMQDSIRELLEIIMERKPSNNEYDSNHEKAMAFLETTRFGWSFKVAFGGHRSDWKYATNTFRAAQTLEYESLVMRLMDNFVALVDYLEQKAIIIL